MCPWHQLNTLHCRRKRARVTAATTSNNNPTDDDDASNLDGDEGEPHASLHERGLSPRLGASHNGVIPAAEFFDGEAAETEEEEEEEEDDDDDDDYDEKKPPQSRRRRPRPLLKNDRAIHSPGLNAKQTTATGPPGFHAEEMQEANESDFEAFFGNLDEDELDDIDLRARDEA